MRFRDWLVTEMGHFRIPGKGLNFTAVFHGKPTPFRNVVLIDPRFEMYGLGEMPRPDGKPGKYMGQGIFSLPLISPQGHSSGWITVQNDMMISGTGAWTDHPEGVRAPLNWADKAIIIDGEDRTLNHPEGLPAQTA